MAPKKQATVEADPYASMPDAVDPYAAMPDAGQGAADPLPHGLPATATMKAAPKMFSPDWFREARWRAAHAALDALPMAGSVVGGLLAGAVASPSGPGAFAAGVGGATAGGAVGESVRIPLQRAIFPASKGWDEGPTGAKAITKDIAIEGGIQGLNEVSGRVGAKMLAPVARYFGNTATASAKAGIRLLPSEARGGAETWIERNLKGSIFTAGKMEQFRVMQNAQTRSAAEDVAKQLSNFSGTPEQAGELVQKGFESHTAAFRAQQNAMYDAIDQQTAEKMVQKPVTKTVGAGFMQTTKTVMEGSLEGPAMPSTAPLKEFAKKQMALLEQQEKILDPSVLAQSRGMLQTIISSPDKVTFKAMAATRSDLLALTRRLDEALPGKQAGFAKKLAGLADESMMSAAENSGIPDLPHAIRNANALTAETHRIYEQQLVKKAVESKKPEVISRLIGANGVGLAETRDLIGAIPESTRGVVRQQIVLDSIRQSVNRKSGVFDERKFSDLVTKMGDERGQVVFGKAWKSVNDLANLMRKINGPASGLGSGAALQNAGVFGKVLGIAGGTVGTTIPTVLGATGHASEAGAAVGIEAAGLAATAVAYKTFAAAITHPETAAKVVRAMQVGIRATPYAATGGYEVVRGQMKVSKGLQKIRDQHVEQMQPPQQ